ncbi:MAG: NAD(P)-dependent glycerol-3-phosphate dehydrogenase [Hyphomonadaceae bacterium]|nr:NAD(P)-dependent glycerol-3-phosphate dehydrogenase [Hyphomonadaceae bacterium]MBP9234199.1 NAD(P)-dependent glycerol-3-phosphate dehydrogenase [Hyphomonadaceae bacterium]
MKSSGDIARTETIFQRIGVAGAGAWGTALAICAGAAGRDVKIWAREPEIAATLTSGDGNPAFLPATSIPAMPASTDMAHLADCDAILLVAPAQHLRATLKSLAPHLKPATPIALCSKGIERGTHKLMTDVLAEEASHASPAVLSGPSFAIDVARGLPTAVTLACPDRATGDAWVRSIGRPHFRMYWSDDLVGAEAGGAIKNVLAIACGVCEGLGLGRSAHAALIARGFAEMTRLGTRLGGRPETLAGLCGLGDLVLTCSSPQSRNMSFGMELGRGKSAADILASRKAVTEGVETAPAVVELARKLKVDLPICEVVLNMIEGRLDARSAVDRLLNRPMKEEA